MGYGNLVRDASTGHLNYDTSTGHLIYKDWVDFGATESYEKTGEHEHTDPDAYPSVDDVYPGALSVLEPDDWWSGRPVRAYADSIQTHPTGEPYSTSVILLAGAMLIDVSAYAGKTLSKIRITCSTFAVYTATECRVSYATDDEVTPDDSWSWTAASPYLVITGSGAADYTLATPIVLGDSLWLTIWFSDYYPDTTPFQANQCALSTSVRLWFSD
jgi:hypothetical protein